MPRWILGLIIATSAVEPITHAVLLYGLPDSMAPTGLHIGDTAFFLTAMRIFLNGFDSPYATCQSPAGYASATYFNVPHDWLYGLLGCIAAIVQIPPFLFLGIANGIGVLLYLLAVYWFLRETTGDRANLAFLIFALSGGLGGLVYILSGIVGAHDLPGFEAWFHRYARYELIEGPFLAPWLVAPRLYYTLPLALGFAALTLWLRDYRRGRSAPGWAAVIAVFLCGYLNLRLGPLFVAVAVLYAVLDRFAPWRRRILYVVAFAIPVFLAVTMVLFQFRADPAGAENAYGLLHRSAWFGSVFALLFWQLFVLPFSLRAGWKERPWPVQFALGALLGYLALFTMLYAVHQVYWGNLFAGGDTAAAIAVSDWALLGVLPGIAITGWLYSKRVVASSATDQSAQETRLLAWCWLWLLIFLAAVISAFGQGQFMRFMPERLLVLIGVPVAVLSAEGLRRMPSVFSRAILGVLVVSGICSFTVAALCFQGPLGFHLKGAFAWTHNEVMSPVDARLIKMIDRGVVLCPASMPPLFGDIVVHTRPQTRTLFGQATMDYSGIDMETMGREVQHFFDPATPDEERRAFVEKWCVDYVYCPETCPVNGDMLQQLKKASWLHEVAGEDLAALFRVRKIPEKG